jgi:hypothetical protein
VHTPQKWFAPPKGIWHPPKAFGTAPKSFCTPANYIYFDLIVSYLIILTTKFVTQKLRATLDTNFYTNFNNASFSSSLTDSICKF